MEKERGGREREVGCERANTAERSKRVQRPPLDFVHPAQSGYIAAMPSTRPLLPAVSLSSSPSSSPSPQAARGSPGLPFIRSRHTSIAAPDATSRHMHGTRLLAFMSGSHSESPATPQLSVVPAVPRHNAFYSRVVPAVPPPNDTFPPLTSPPFPPWA